MQGLGAATAAIRRLKRGLATPPPTDANPRLAETHSFGANPGGLRLFAYVPDDLPAGAPLVVVLHGCTQTAEGYVRGAGWAAAADRYGFAVLAPEQTTAKNHNRCFTWWEPEDVRRGAGEVASVRAMIEHMIVAHRLDRARVFVTGLSAGGAMTAALLATYPEVFAAGAIIAGLPFGAAASLQQAFGSMFQSPPKPAQEWGDLVRRASPHVGRWPRVAVWHGSADATVIPGNALEAVKQWTNVHGLDVASGVRDGAGPHAPLVWRDRSGTVLVQSHTLDGLGHGTPVSAAEGLGAAEAYFLEAGVSSTLEIARFWNLAPPADPLAAAASAGARPDDWRPGVTRAYAPVSDPQPAANADFSPERVINDALRAAGLMR